jgi:hypothetical protein
MQAFATAVSLVLAGSAAAAPLAAQKKSVEIAPGAPPFIKSRDATTFRGSSASIGCTLTMVRASWSVDWAC